MYHGTILPEKRSLDSSTIFTDCFHHLEFFVEYLEEFIFFLDCIEEIEEVTSEFFDFSLL
jgi:hypothetical protein